MSDTKSQPEAGDNLLRHAVPVFIVCVIGYALLYGCDAKLRTSRGPWSVTFDVTADQTPRLTISQPSYGIKNVDILFPGESITLTNGATDILFTHPKVELPFGEIRHHDLMYQPGVVTLLVFNHEIELIRRGLFIDRQEFSWQEADGFRLAPTNQPPPRHPERKRSKDLEQ